MKIAERRKIMSKIAELITVIGHISKDDVSHDKLMKHCRDMIGIVNKDKEANSETHRRIMDIVNRQLTNEM